MQQGNYPVNSDFDQNMNENMDPIRGVRPNSYASFPSNNQGQYFNSPNSYSNNNKSWMDKLSPSSWFSSSRNSSPSFLSQPPPRGYGGRRNISRFQMRSKFPFRSRKQRPSKKVQFRLRNLRGGNLAATAAPFHNGSSAHANLVGGRRRRRRGTRKCRR